MSWHNYGLVELADLAHAFCRDHEATLALTYAPGQAAAVVDRGELGQHIGVGGSLEEALYHALLGAGALPAENSRKGRR